MHPAMPMTPPTSSIPLTEVGRAPIQLPAIHTAKKNPHSFSKAPMPNLATRASSQRRWNFGGTSDGLAVTVGTAMLEIIGNAGAHL